MAGGFTSDDEVISGINVTPLVDVVLVLLIIFMITAPVLYQSAIKVQLPKANSGEQADKGPLTFSISKEGKLAWDKEQLEWDALPGRLQALSKRIDQETAIINADEAVSHGTVIKLMDALRQAGLTKFALNVETGGTQTKSR
jgi:biopolymer transport protein ExbD